MADIIQLLPDAIANQIAAGEVIQRPASVVKELVENAVDAGADHVRLIVKDSGKTLIQVIDNGCGMSETDARMSLERHATSKIRQASDLFAIRTMGFRGEALASMAAVAQLELRTRRYADELGTRLLVEGSEVKAQEACQCEAGTSIAVRNLFYNVPARRNFLKSNAVEMRHILDEYQRIALANPDVVFSLHHNNEEVLHLPVGNLRQRIVGVFGQVYNKRLVPVGQETDVLKVSGFVGKPEFAKKSRGEQYFFVNKRFIRSNYLNHAVLSAFEELLPKEVYPLYVLFLDIDPERIDINVHPTKQEIKFDDERLVYNYLKVAVRHALGQHNVMPTLDFDQENTLMMSASTPPPQRAYPTVGSISGASPRDRDRSVSFDAGSEQARAASNLRNWEQLYTGLEAEPSPAPTFSPEEVAAGAITIESQWTNEQPAGNEPAQAEKEPYQLHGSYIVSQIKSGFVLIDQQAAHERILYERYLDALSKGQAVSQRQLFPRTLTLPPADSALLLEMLPELNNLGFDIQEFGKNAFVVNGLPTEIAGKKDEEKIVDLLLAQYRANLELKLGVHESIARAMARGGGIRRGQVLATAEMKALIDQLFACRSPYRSPFGRQCLLTFTLEELNQRFDT